MIAYFVNLLFGLDVSTCSQLQTIDTIGQAVKPKCDLDAGVDPKDPASVLIVSGGTTATLFIQQLDKAMNMDGELVRFYDDNFGYGDFCIRLF